MGGGGTIVNIDLCSNWTSRLAFAQIRVGQERLLEKNMTLQLHNLIDTKLKNVYIVLLNTLPTY